MLAGRFARHIKLVPPRNLVRINLFMHFVERKIQEATQRSSHLTPNRYGSRLLIDIIKLADLEYLLFSTKSDDEKLRYLVSIAKDLEKPIDVRNGKNQSSDLFVRSRTSCFELVTPARQSDPLVDVPYGLPYSHPDWNEIKPFRVWDMGNCDLTFNAYEGQLTFYNRAPVNAIYSVDCVALIAKFVAYYQTQLPVRDLDQCLLDFVHNEIIVPSLLRDASAIWLRNMYRGQLLSSSPLESLTSTMWDVVNIDVVGSDFTPAMRDIVRLREDLANHSISYQTTMSSLPLSTDGMSFGAFYKDLYESATLPDLQPLAWVECIKNISWIEFMVMLTSFNPEGADVLSFKRDIVRDVRLWIMMKPWDAVAQSIPFKSIVRAKLEGLYSYLNNN